MKGKNIKNESLPSIEVIDLFCGIGGLSFGMKSKGFNILAGYDIDATCRYAYETNNNAKFIYKDIKRCLRMKSAQPTAKDLLECWQDAPLVNRFRRMHSKTKRKIRINTIYYMNSDDWSRLFIPTSLRWKTWLKSYLSNEKPVLSDFENLLKNEGIMCG